MAEKKTNENVKKYVALQFMDIRSYDMGNIRLMKGEITEREYNRVKKLLPNDWQKYVKEI